MNLCNELIQAALHKLYDKMAQPLAPIHVSNLTNEDTFLLILPANG